MILVIATLATALLGLEQAADGSTLVGALVLLIAMVKVRLVGMHFMELDRAPVLLRLAFEGYVVVLAGTLMGIYLGA
ncbi:MULTISPECIES: cytochrome C oxidase subunit IV family protein [unclassified Pseudonocardia]|uniref:cytochrome C oxidase subunit IV family protein n=1 Tax=unclassified Pseudonocardia TaxID=2619320 RepID=UPI0001FFE562|nr:cytochrome C oxidase subunit IV family protein [Pseudonocardia sp. Ae707_Ps1]